MQKKKKSTAHLSVHSNKNKRWDRGIRFCIINYSTPFISSFFLLKFVTFICLARYTLQRVVKKILYICTESWAVWISAFPFFLFCSGYLSLSLSLFDLWTFSHFQNWTIGMLFIHCIDNEKESCFPMLANYEHKVRLRMADKTAPFFRQFFWTSKSSTS